jgi:hypothetical protein
MMRDIVGNAVLAWGYGVWGWLGYAALAGGALFQGAELFQFSLAISQHSIPYNEKEGYSFSSFWSFQGFSDFFV